MTGSRKKIALMFAALMITSVFAVGTAWAASSSRGTATGFPVDSTGNVGEGGEAFQGETEIGFQQGDFTGPPSKLESAPDQEFSLSLTSSVVPEGQQPALYRNFEGSATGETIRVSTPELIDLELINENGNEVSDTTVPEDQVLVVTAEWNYMKAEDIQLTIEDEDGFEIQNAVLTDDTSLLSDQQDFHINNTTGWTSFPGTTGVRGEPDELNTRQQGIGNTDLQDGDRAVWAIELADLDAGTYTIIAEGIEDFEEGEGPDEAVQTTTIDVTTADEAELELESDEVTQGEKVRYTISGSISGATHLIAVENDSSIFRDNVAPADRANLFEEVGDVVPGSAGNNSDWIFANVTIDEDDGLGEGRLDTQVLQDTDLEIELYNQTGTSSTPISSILGESDFRTDTVDLQVLEGDLTIDNPGQTYVPGQEVDANGTATPGTDDVAIYARDQGNWFLSFVADVDADDEWEEEDIILSQESRTSEANNIFSIPGVYRIGIIDAADADPDDQDAAVSDANNDPDSELTITDFNVGLSDARSIRIAQPSLSATFAAYNEQVYLPSPLEVEGTSIGQDEVVFVSSDSRGGSWAESINVDDDDEFDSDIALTGRSSLFHSEHSMAPGAGTVLVLSQGRDNMFGDGEFTSTLTGVSSAVGDTGVNNLVLGIRESHRNGRAPDQKSADLLSETVQDTGSDDLLVSRDVRFTDDAQTSIEDIVPVNSSNATGIRDIRPGETALVRGLTNLNPEDFTIVVEPIDGPDVNKIEVNSTDEWNTSGIWSTTIHVPSDTTPGNYTIQADSGEDSDRAHIQITPDAQRPLPTTDIDALQNQIQELENEVDNLEQQNSELQNEVSQLEQRNQNLTEQRDRLQERVDNLTENGGNGEQTPGFTPVIAVIALIAAALLALRLRE